VYAAVWSRPGAEIQALSIVHLRRENRNCFFGQLSCPREGVAQDQDFIHIHAKMTKFAVN